MRTAIPERLSGENRLLKGLSAPALAECRSIVRANAFAGDRRLNKPSADDAPAEKRKTSPDGKRRTQIICAVARLPAQRHALHHNLFFPERAVLFFRRLGRSSGFRIKLALHLPAAIVVTA